MERYDILRDLGSGNFGVAKLVREKANGKFYAVKYIERGLKIDEHVQREIINHRDLKHPNIIRFKEVFVTPTHLAIVMEYAAGGELFERICSAGRFSEDEARYYFKQLISGVSYCHAMQICHRDLKLENTLLDGSPSSQLKICDFGYSKSSVLHSQPKSTVGTPAYVAPEVLSRKEYNGKIADVWSCGVTLYVMLVGAYPFEDPDDPRNIRKTIQRILNVQYTIPDYVRISSECKHLLSRIFVAGPDKRITVPEIEEHSWFLKNPGPVLADKNIVEEEEEEERKRERSENDGGEKAEESERENRSMNESNSTDSGEKTVGEEEPGRTRGDDLDPDPVNTAEEGSGASDSGELGESGTSGRKWKRKRRKDSDGEIRSAASESQPLIRLLDLIRSHPRGSLFERRVRSQETTDYKSLVKQHLDIETIQRKLTQGSYDSSKLTFYRDLQLLFANVIVFFPSSSSESMAAHELRAIVSEEMRKESGKSSPRLFKASPGMTSIKAEAAETSEQKSSAPLVVCKRRRFVSAKAKASPSSSSFSQKEETKEEILSEENENVETGGRSSKRTANNIKTGKGKNKQKEAEEAKTERKVVVSSDKKKSVADFLKRIKKSSPQKEDKDQNKSKKESKPKPRELRSNNVGKKKKAEVENAATPAKRAPGRPPQKKNVEAVATASGKRGRESGSTGKDNKQPKKRSRR